MISIIQEYYALIMQSTGTTVLAWLTCSTLSIILGTVFGIIRSQQARVFILGRCLDFYVFILCAIPLYVQILCAYFVIPDLLCIKISPWTAGIWALGLCSSAYTSEIIKSGIQAIATEQWETARALGYSNTQIVRYIVLPQVFAQTFPLLLNECNLILKSTALFSSIGILELTKTALNISMRTYNPLPIYTIVALIYIILTTCITAIAQQYKPQEVLS